MEIEVTLKFFFKILPFTLQAISNASSLNHFLKYLLWSWIKASYKFSSKSVAKNYAQQIKELRIHNQNSNIWDSRIEVIFTLLN